MHMRGKRKLCKIISSNLHKSFLNSFLDKGKILTNFMLYLIKGWFVYNQTFNSIYFDFTDILETHESEFLRSFRRYILKYPWIIDMNRNIPYLPFFNRSPNMRYIANCASNPVVSDFFGASLIYRQI